MHQRGDIDYRALCYDSIARDMSSFYSPMALRRKTRDRSIVCRSSERGGADRYRSIDRAVVHPLRSINSRWKVMPYPFIAPLCRLRQLKKASCVCVLCICIHRHAYTHIYIYMCMNHTYIHTYCSSMIESSTVDLYDRSIDPYDTSGIRMSQFCVRVPIFVGRPNLKLGRCGRPN